MDWMFCLSLLLKAWCLTATIMALLWLLQVRFKNASFVDIGWTAGIGVCAVFYATLTGDFVLRKLLLLAIVGLWCLRLLTLLFLRLSKDPTEDPRYARIRREWKSNQDFKFFLMFQFQGFLDVVLSWPFVLICLNPNPHVAFLEIIGFLLSVIGLVGETIADTQLKAFKRMPANKGKTCDRGLWHYSRHPNYFFEWLIWVGYFTVALSAPWGISAVIAPILMFIFLLKVSGVPLAEAQALKTKGQEYRRYQESTSMFIPWFKRRIK